MEIQSTTQTTNTHNTQSVKATKNDEISKLSFTIEPNQELDPYSLSFNDYQKLTFDDLEVIYQNEPHPRKTLGAAQGLLSTSKLTDDNILNEIFFDDRIEAHKQGTSTSMSFHAMAMIGIKDMMENGIDIPTDRLALTPEQRAEPFWQDMIARNNNNQESKRLDLLNATNILEEFKNFKDFFYSDMSDGWTGTTDINPIFESMNNTIDKYQQKLDENNAILNSLTKNTKQNPLDSINQSSKEKDNIPRNNKGQNFLDIVDEVDSDAFKKLNISKEDEILFRTILKDSDVTASEARNLTYDQASKLGKFVFDSLSTLMKDRPDNEIPIVMIGNPVTANILYSANLTNDKTFNQAIHKMVLENTTVNRHDMSSFLSEITSNIMQMHYNEEFAANFMPNTFSGDIEHPYFLEKDNIDIDFEELLHNAISIYGDKSKIKNAAQEQYKELTDLYSTLDTYYMVLSQALTPERT